VALPRLAGVARELLERSDVHALVVAVLPSRGVTVEVLAGALREAGRAAGKPVVAAFTGITDPTVPAQGLLRADGATADSGPSGEQAPSPARLQDALPAYSNPGDAITALAAVVRYAAWREHDFGVPVESAGIDRDRADELLLGHMEHVRGTDLVRLDATDTQDLLGCYGISVLESIPFDTEDEAVAAANRIGWPVALKARDGHLRHRLDLGGVRLNIIDEASLRGNIRHMQQMLQPYGIVELEVQTMASSGQGCVVRALEDPLLGPLLSFGLAGDAVNLLDDWAHAIPPLTDTDLSEFVRSPRASRRLFGYEGFPPVHVRGLEDFLNRVATLKDDHPEVALLEFNPVLVSATDVTVLSADVRIGNPAQRTDSARRAMR
jgi:acyl-CoA synthetase (NDP forming)